jgi:hypothetical protein
VNLTVALGLVIEVMALFAMPYTRSLSTVNTEIKVNIILIAERAVRKTLFLFVDRRSIDSLSVHQIILR